MKNPSSILITGASSGLGAAMALHYARPGVTLHLTGRSTERLEKVEKVCVARGSRVHSAVLDVCHREAMANWIVHQDVQAPLDLVIANAGISAGTGGLTEPESQVRGIFAANVDGVLNTILPAIPLMQTRKRGQLALMSSLAGIRGLPSSPAYSASKAAVRVYGEGLRGHLKKFGIEVSVICPGYVKTPMTEVNDFPMPFLMSAEKAARIIADGLARNRGRIAFPWQLYIPLWLATCLPTSWTDGFFAALPAKAISEH